MRRGLTLVAGLLLSFGLVPAVAHAAVVPGATSTFPTSVTVGDVGVSATVEVRNDNTTPDDAATNTVCNVGDGGPCIGRGTRLTPSCGLLLQGNPACAGAAGADPGVFSLSATGQGQAGTACAGVNFAIVVIAQIFGDVRFTPLPAGTHVLLPGAGTLCRIGFTFDVLKSPTVDQNPILAGRQTVQIMDTTQQSGGVAGAQAASSSGTTVLPAPTTIVTTASPNITLGAGTLTETAIVSGRV